MVQVPEVFPVTVVLLTEQIVGVVLFRVTGRPEEAVALALAVWRAVREEGRVTVTVWFCFAAITVTLELPVALL